MQYAKSVTLNVEECDRLSFLPYLFGQDFLYAEASVYALAKKMMPEYEGGFWHFIRLPDGGGYMMPDGDRFHMVNGANWFDRTVSADAAGVILTSLVINRQLWLYHDSGDAGLLTWCETRTWWRSAETMLLLAMWLPFSGTSYGIAGLLMLAVSHRLYRAEDRMERLALVACLLAVIPALNLATSDAAAVAGLVMTVLTVGLVSCTGKSLPRFWYGDFFPTFYACHLTVLGVLAV